MISQSPVTNHRSPRAKRAPFALLIVIVLLAFVVVLLVGLATYTRIESAVATNTQRQAQARQNALLGLNVALAQLQKYAGPDQRVTATAESTAGVNAQKAHYTGVWHTDPTATADALTPLAWLVSGAEAATPSEDVTAAIPNTRAVQLVGTKSAGTANSVVATTQDITATGVPGATGAAPVIGRYAWWVGDQGVKAPVAVVDRSAKITYSPFGDGTAQNELGKRLRQQLTLGAGPADAAGAAVFEPNDTNNAPVLGNDRVTAQPQLAFVKTSASGVVGLTRLQQNFHVWSPNNFAVLANTKLGGLRQDLSQKPDLLGPGFVAWADYKSYMEDPAAPGAPEIVPAYGPASDNIDPLRRRYRITPSATPGIPGVAPVLTYFYILVGIGDKPNGGSPLKVSIRWAAALWNPYSSALVPEDLRLEVSGLPDRLAIYARPAGDPPGSGILNASFSLRDSYGTMKLELPWVNAPAKSEEASWLPGRVYNWVSTPDAAFARDGANTGDYASRNIPGLGNGLLTYVNSAVAGTSMLTVSMDDSPTLRVKLIRKSDNQLLAEYRSPTYDAFATTDEFEASGSTSPFGFLFRLRESFDTAATNPGEWLTTPNRDPRHTALPPDAMTTSPKTTNPTDCKNFTTISFEERLLDRDISRGTSYNEDVPLFELPRAPLLSLGELQHLPINGLRPFSIGNSWGALSQLNTSPLNSVFDRFFFSGLAGAAPDFAAGERLPNPLLLPLPRKSDGTAVTASDLTTAAEQSSRYLLQAGAFDVNSVSAVAWASVLRGVRFDAAKPFTYVDASSTTGTGGDNAPAEFSTTNALFFRFAQSAQEVYKADDDYAQSTTGSGAGPIINTPLFRRGVRSLDAKQIAALANAIVANIRVKQADSGPFRSLEEFLNPSSLLNDQSVIEKAIADAGLNANVAEFSSQFLTQGDIMTALAPVLFPRSDTFVIRAYGEALNPTTGVMEGRAWCEATVQRFPEYFNATADDATVSPDQLTDPSNLNQTYGRRFKVVSFRWLTRSDI